MSDRVDDQIHMVTDFQIKISNALGFDSTNYYPTVKRNFYSNALYRARMNEVIN